jgi:hypothetical protein
VPFGKQPIQEGLITATDHPALGCGRGARASRHRGVPLTPTVLSLTAVASSHGMGKVRHGAMYVVGMTAVD